MSFRIFQPGTQFFTNDGKVLAGGSLWFFDSGTSNPADTYSDPTLTTPNPNPVPLDGAGRPNTDIWGDGSYRVVLKDAGGVTLVTMDNVSGPQGIPDPALEAGKFLTNDGTDLFWDEIRELPDPDGASAGEVLTADGAGNVDWQPIPSTRSVPDPSGAADGDVLTVDSEETAGYKWAPAPEPIEDKDLVSNGYALLHGGLMIQWGTTGVVPALGTKSVAFPKIFDNRCLSVVMTAANTGGTSQAADQVSNVTASSFTANNAGSVGRNFYFIAIGY
jgi:hypothetical protein